MLSGLSSLSQLFWSLGELRRVKSPEIHLKRKSESMGRPSHAREKLRQVASYLIWENIYVSVSINQICLRDNVRKGSSFTTFSAPKLIWRLLPAKCAGRGGFAGVETMGALNDFALEAVLYHP